MIKNYKFKIDISEQTILLGISAFGGGILLATVKELSKILPPIWSVIAEEKINHLHLMKVFSVVYAAFFGLTLSFYAYEKRSDIMTKPKISRKTIINDVEFKLSSNIPWYAGNSQDPLVTFYFVFDKDANQDSVSANGNSAVNPDKQFFNPLLTLLMSGLSQCAKNDEYVNIQIVDFASSSLWSASSEEQNNIVYPVDYRTNNPGEAFNLIIAERRANNVKKELDRVLKGLPHNQIKVTVKRWKDY